MTRETTENTPACSKSDLYLDLAIMLYKAGASVQRISDSV